MMALQKSEALLEVNSFVSLAIEQNHVTGSHLAQVYIVKEDEDRIRRP